MYIHLIGLAYILYAFSFMWVIYSLLDKRIRDVPVVVNAMMLVSGILFARFLLRENPLAGMRDVVLLLLGGISTWAALCLWVWEQEPHERIRAKATFFIGLANFILGLVIGLVQLDSPPVGKLVHW